jgi:hypothetical protein
VPPGWEPAGINDISSPLLLRLVLVVFRLVFVAFVLVFVIRILGLDEFQHGKWKRFAEQIAFAAIHRQATASSFTSATVSG